MQFESFGKYQSTELHSFLLSAVSNFSDDDGGDYVVSGDYDHDDDNEDMMKLKIIYVGAKLVAEVQGWIPSLAAADAVATDQTALML